MVGAVFSSLNPAEAQQQRSSRVDATVTPQGNKFLYEFILNNTSSPTPEPESIVDWELPFWALQDLDLNSIMDPPG
jgi:hypothetical protein